MAPVPSSLAPQWSDLPPELLVLVFLRLPKRADRAFFAAVCRAWCSAARSLPPPSPVPWLVHPNGRVTSFPRGKTFQLLPYGVRHHASYGEWLLLSRPDDSCFLMNYFTKATMPLPSLSSYSYYQEPVDVTEYIGIELTWSWMHNTDIGEMPAVLSLVVCSTRLVAAILAFGGFCTIALCRPGATSWSVSAHKGCMVLSQMVFFQGKLYAIDTSYNGGEHLIAVDIVDENDSDQPRVSRIGHLRIGGANLPTRRHSECMHYLVESHGKLLMVCREHSDERQDGTIVAGSNECQVFEADFEQRLWAEVRTLGNSQALFVGQQYSQAVHVSPYDVSRDCVFFVDDCPSKQTTESCGVYDMKDEKVYSPFPTVSWKSGKVPATWIFSQDAEEIDKLQTEGEGSQEVVEPGEDHLTLCVEGLALLMHRLFTEEI